ncbi:MAG: histidine kinase [Bacteroidetes bacterium]|jgi:two-component system LytT family sensor kinase|nr:histidine kinase [Bacteroidota bacterium]
MSKKHNIYWNCQFIGWSLYAAINLIFFKLSYNTNLKDILLFLIWLPLGITITHAYRYLILKFNVLRFSLLIQIPLILIASLVMSILFFIINISIVNIFSSNSESIDLLAATSKILSLVLIFVIWSVIYFGFHFFDNYKKTEIQNLRLEANSKEVELNKLKSQLNPHFMFNSMNSIRALVDEDPKKAKIAITQLSNILRNTLMMHKNRYISLEEEIALVKDYLELEHIRFEERLHFNFDIDPQTLTLNVPPMMIQTLVENGIKHGIGKYPEGGNISIVSLKTDSGFKIEIINTGQLGDVTKTDSGFGVANTTNRLELLFGKKASFNLKNLDDKNVISEITIKT